MVRIGASQIYTLDAVSQFSFVFFNGRLRAFPLLALRTSLLRAFVVVDDPGNDGEHRSAKLVHIDWN